MEACKDCVKNPCAYLDNILAMDRVEKKGWCPFNYHPIVDKTDSKWVDPLKASKQTYKVKR